MGWVRSRWPRPPKLQPRPARVLPSSPGLWGATVTDPDGTVREVELTAFLGAARLYQVAEGEATGILVVQPSGKSYWLQEPLPPEPWSLIP